MGLATEIDKITHILTIVATVVFLAVIILAGVYFLYYKKKRRVKAEDIQTDYSQLRRVDSIDYLKFDDIRDNMVITDNGKRFIGAISCKGFEYQSAHVAERINAQNGYRGFIGTIHTPITYRLYNKSIDMDYTLNRYKEAYQNIEERLFNLNADYQDLEKLLERLEKELGEDAKKNPDVLKVLNEMSALKKQIDTLKWRKFHIEDQLEYGRQISGDEANPEMMETYIFDWVYYPMEYPVDLSKDEIYKEAMKNLSRMEKSFVHALSLAGVKAKRCSTVDLIRQFRKHMRPISAERYKLEDDIENDPFFKEIISTEKKDELAEEFYNELEFGIESAINRAAGEVRNSIVRDVLEKEEVHSETV